jgi:AraC-like DNA-binding protein
LEDLAKEFAMSSSKLKRLFKAIHGVTIAEYSRALRMHKAKTLLRNSDKSVSQIAADLGYEHASSFITAYKRSFGATPKAFRRLTAGK